MVKVDNGEHSYPVACAKDRATNDLPQPRSPIRQMSFPTACDCSMPSNGRHRQAAKGPWSVFLQDSGEGASMLTAPHAARRRMPVSSCIW